MCSPAPAIAALCAKVDGLPLAIELASFSGLTQEEIAEFTETPLGAVKGRLRLGRHKLRATLADLLPRENDVGSLGSPVG